MSDLSSLSPAHHAAWLQAMVDAARGRPAGKLDITDPSGAVIATVQAHDLARRPKDMPRALRPKQKLSKRQRTAAKLSKIREAEAEARHERAADEEQAVRALEWEREQDPAA